VLHPLEALKNKGIRPCVLGRKSHGKVFLSAIALAATVMFWL
jgi:hypothetical protein